MKAGFNNKTLKGIKEERKKGDVKDGREIATFQSPYILEIFGMQYTPYLY